MTHHTQGAAFFYAPLVLLIDREPIWERGDALTGYYILNNERERAVEDMLDLQLWNSKNMGKAWRPNHLRWLGLDKEVPDAVQTARQVTEGHTWWISNVAKLTTGEWTEEDFLKSAHGNLAQKSHHLMAVAFERLTEPDRREEAIDALNQSVALDMRTMDFHYWSLAALKILDKNPEWPDSLRPN